MHPYKKIFRSAKCFCSIYLIYILLSYSFFCKKSYRYSFRGAKIIHLFLPNNKNRRKKYPVKKNDTNTPDATLLCGIFMVCTKNETNLESFYLSNVQFYSYL